MPRLQNFFRPWRRAERPLRAEGLLPAFVTWASSRGQQPILTRDRHLALDQPDRAVSTPVAQVIARGAARRQYFLRPFVYMAWKP